MQLSIVAEKEVGSKLQGLWVEHMEKQKITVGFLASRIWEKRA